VLDQQARPRAACPAWTWHPSPPQPQNHRMVGVGRDLWGSSSPTLLPKQGHHPSPGYLHEPMPPCLFCLDSARLCPLSHPTRLAMATLTSPPRFLNSPIVPQTSLGFPRVRTRAVLPFSRQQPWLATSGTVCPSGIYSAWTQQGPGWAAEKGTRNTTKPGASHRTSSERR